MEDADNVLAFGRQAQDYKGLRIQVLLVFLAKLIPYMNSSESSHSPRFHDRTR